VYFCEKNVLCEKGDEITRFDGTAHTYIKYMQLQYTWKSLTQPLLRFSVISSDICGQDRFFSESKFWEGLHFDMRGKIRSFKTGLQISLSRDQSYGLPYLFWQTLVLMLQNGDITSFWIWTPSPYSERGSIMPCAGKSAVSKPVYRSFSRDQSCRLP
jgi:hypothetical protein